MAKIAFPILKLSAPAYIVLVAYITVSVIILLPFQFPVYDEKTDKEYIVRYDVFERFLMLLMLLLPFALTVYSINCMMVGNCKIWSYAVSLVSVFWVVAFVISALYYTFRK
jgi:hypothetical protein